MQKFQATVELDILGEIIDCEIFAYAKSKEEFELLLANGIEIDIDDEEPFFGIVTDN